MIDVRTISLSNCIDINLNFKVVGGILVYDWGMIADIDITTAFWCRMEGSISGRAICICFGLHCVIVLDN